MVAVELSETSPVFWLPPLVGHGFVHRVCTFGVLRISFRLRRKNKKKNPPSEEPQKTKNNGWCTFTVPCVDARVQYISRRCTVDRTPSLNLRCSASYGRIPNLRFFNILFLCWTFFPEAVSAAPQFAPMRPVRTPLRRCREKVHSVSLYRATL